MQAVMHKLMHRQYFIKREKFPHPCNYGSFQLIWKYLKIRYLTYILSDNSVRQDHNRITSLQELEVNL